MCSRYCKGGRLLKGRCGYGSVRVMWDLKLLINVMVLWCVYGWSFKSGRIVMKITVFEKLIILFWEEGQGWEFFNVRWFSKLIILFWEEGHGWEFFNVRWFAPIFANDFSGTIISLNWEWENEIYTLNSVTKGGLCLCPKYLCDSWSVRKLNKWVSHEQKKRKLERKTKLAKPGNPPPPQHCFKQANVKIKMFREVPATK
jgi:hypothetical protein